MVAAMLTVIKMTTMIFVVADYILLLLFSLFLFMVS